MPRLQLSGLRLTGNTGSPSASGSSKAQLICQHVVVCSHLNIPDNWNLIVRQLTVDSSWQLRLRSQAVQQLANSPKMNHFKKQQLPEHIHH